MRRGRWALAAIGLLGGWGAGCTRRSAAELTVATCWTAEERSAVESAFRRWLTAQPGPGTNPGPIHWIALAPDGNWPRAVRALTLAPDPPDLLLGGPSWDYRRLASDARLEAPRADRAPWLAVRRARFGVACNRPALARHGLSPPAAWSDLAAPGWARSVGLEDPRHDPRTLAWAAARLNAGDWPREYGQLVRIAANAHPIEWGDRSARSELRRGAVAAVPTVEPPGPEGPATAAPTRADPGAEVVFLSLSDDSAPAWVEGAAVVHGSRNPVAAQAFLRFLDEWAGARRDPDRAEPDPGVVGLLADLLGATLVDAQPELRATWARLIRAGRPRRLEGFLTEAPPWPPASVVRMMERQDFTAVEILAEQIAPDPEVRARLLESWEQPARPIDGSLLEELAGAVGGRLAAEPRFRAWLRAEWTAWARQRYRRVGRLIP